MAVKGQSLSMQTGQRITERLLALAFSGNYVAGGDTLDLTNIDQTTIARIDGFANFTYAGIKITYPVSESGGYYFEVIKGTTLKNYKIKAYQPTGTEVVAGAYPAPMSAPPQPESFAIGIQSVSGK